MPDGGTPDAAPPVLSARELQVQVRLPPGPWRRGGVARAVDGVSLDLRPGETLGVLGESGCGKTALARALLRLVPIAGGSLRLEGREIGRLSQHALRPLRPRMQMLLSDPSGSLDARRTVEEIVREPLDAQARLPRQARRERVHALLDGVGLGQGWAAERPAGLSDGQRQRASLARALAPEPRLLVCDDPLAALEVTARAGMANLLRDLQARRGFACLFLGRDPAMVLHMAPRVAVMHRGRIVEMQGCEDLRAEPLHPYTRALLAAADPDPAARGPVPLREGEAPSPAARPGGCGFRTRCPQAMVACRDLDPRLQEVAPGRWVACHLHDEAVMARPDARPDARPVAQALAGT